MLLILGLSIGTILLNYRPERACSPGRAMVGWSGLSIAGEVVDCRLGSKTWACGGAVQRVNWCMELNFLKVQWYSKVWKIVSGSR